MDYATKTYNRRSDDDHFEQVHNDWLTVQRKPAGNDKKNEKSNGGGDDCDLDAAVKWYEDNWKGRFTNTEMILRLFRAGGEIAKPEFEACVNGNGRPDRNFAALVCKAQETLGIEQNGHYDKVTEDSVIKWHESTFDYSQINYDKLIGGDKTLDIGVAIGYIEDGGSKDEYDDIVRVLEGNGMERKEDTPTRTRFVMDREMIIPGQKSKKPRSFKIIVDVVFPDKDNPKQSFSEFLSGKDVAIYSGEARSGAGPDFDSKESTDQNFVLGVNSSKHDGENATLTKGYDDATNKQLAGKKNDLEEMSKKGMFNNDKYQLWMFNGCITKNYLDEVRGGLVTNKKGVTKPQSNLRFFGTSQLVYSGCGPVLNGLLNMQSITEIMFKMDAQEMQNTLQQNKLQHKSDKIHDNYYFLD